MDVVIRLARFYFGSADLALATGMIAPDQDAFVLTPAGAQMVHSLIELARSRGDDVSLDEQLLVQAQAQAAIRQASRQLGRPGDV